MEAAIPLTPAHRQLNISNGRIGMMLLIGTETILFSPGHFSPRLFTPTPKVAKRVLEFFTIQINNDHTR